MVMRFDRLYGEAVNEFFCNGRYCRCNLRALYYGATGLKSHQNLERIVCPACAIWMHAKSSHSPHCFYVWLNLLLFSKRCGHSLSTFGYPCKVNSEDNPSLSRRDRSPVLIWHSNSVVNPSPLVFWRTLFW
jgi:hypothetical protein